MGGDAFDKSLGITRLTNEEFIQETAQISELIAHVCVRAEVYIPMPEKESHGDIDYLVILKPNYSLIDLAEAISSKDHIIAKQTINCIYNKHQVDFKSVGDDEEFEMTKFYKAYSGLGYILGYFTYKHNVKFSEYGLYVFQREVVGNVKLEYLLTNNVEKICEVYGVSYEDYRAGFKSKNQLMGFLSSSKYFNLDRVIDTNPKDVNKLYMAFKQYCMENREALSGKSNEMGEEMFQNLLKKFGRLEQYEQKKQSLIQEAARAKQLQEKFNGGHIQEHFGLQRKEIGDAKQRFLESFPSKEQYERFILESEFQHILAQFKKRAVE